MKKAITIGLSFIWFSVSFGQSQFSSAIAESIMIEIERDEEVMIQNLEVEKKRIELKISKEKWLPRITADYSTRYNTQLQSTVLPDNFGDSEDNRITFGTKNNSSLSLNMNQSIYDGSNVLDIRIAEIELKRAELDLAELKLHKQVEVLNDMIDYAYYSDLYELYSDVSRQNDSLMMLAETKFANGLISEIDLLKIKVKHSNQNNLIIGVKDDFRKIEGFVSQKYQTYEVLKACGGLHEINLEGYLDTQLVSVELDKFKLILEETTQKINHVTRLFNPTVSLNANYTTQYQENTFNYLNGNWTPFNYVGISIQLPLFNGNEENRRKQLYKIDEEQQVLNRQRYDQNSVRKRTDWKIKLLSLKEDYNENTKNLEVSEFIYIQELERMMNGTSSMYSYFEAFLEKVASKSNVLRSSRELQKHYLDILNTYDQQ